MKYKITTRQSPQKKEQLEARKEAERFADFRRGSVSRMQAPAREFERAGTDKMSEV